MNREEKQPVLPENYVTNVNESILVGTYRHREKFLWRVLCPVFIVSFSVPLVLLVLDAVGAVTPMDSGLITAFTVLASGGVVGIGAAAGFSLLGNTGHQED